MERAEWLRKIRFQAESLYDHLAPAFWVTFGNYPNSTHLQYIHMLLDRLPPGSLILDAACGAGRYDGLLSQAGQRVLGIDQSASMLSRARQHFAQEQFPGLHYAKKGLQEMEYAAEFEAAMCVDAFEHIPPEDWPGILVRFQQALKPGGCFYFTVEEADPAEVSAAYQRALSQGLPVVPGELVDEVDESFSRVTGLDWQALQGNVADNAVYHYYPSREQVAEWLRGAGLVVQSEALGDGYRHFLVLNP